MLLHTKSWRRRIGLSLSWRRIFLLFNILLALELEQAEVFIGLLQSVVLAIEGMDDVVLLRIDLVLNFDIVFNEVYELLHLSSEKSIDVECEFLSERLYPLDTWASICLTAALRAVIDYFFSALSG